MTGSVDAHPVTRARPLWLQGALALVLASAAFALLPRVAPANLDQESAALLLGILVGLAVGVALRLDARLTPFIAVGASLGAFAASVLGSHADAFTVTVAVVYGIEVYLITTLVRRQGAFRFRNAGDLLHYLVPILTVSTVGGLVVAAVGAIDEHLLMASFGEAWALWVIDDLFGLVVIAPAVVTLSRVTGWTGRQAAEWLAAVGYTALATWFVFFSTDTGTLRLLVWPYFVVLGSIWIAVRMGMRAVAPVVALQFWAALIASAEGLGAFARPGLDALETVLAAQMFAVVMALVVYALAVLRDGRIRSQAQLRQSERLLREVIDGSDALVYAKSYEGADAAAGRYVLANRTWEQITGRSLDSTVGRSDLDLWPPQVGQAFIDVDREVVASASQVEAEEVNVDVTGATRRYHSLKFPLRRPDGSVWGIGGISTDITEVLEAREREARQAELLRAVFELSPTPAIRLTTTGGLGLRVRAANAAMCRLLGVAMGRADDCDLLEHVHPDDTETALEVIRYAMDEAAGSQPAGSGALRQRELRMRTDDGQTVWVLMSAAAVRGGSTDTEIVAQFEDITARRAAELALTDQAMRDTVTGLPNRRALRERMDAALQRLRRHPGWVTVLFCDLDHFKDINDSLGHQVGDALLVEVAARLRSALRPEDTVARLGGDEFVALGEGVEDPNDAVLMALRLQDKLSAPWIHEDQVFRPAMSIGIAMIDDAEVGVDEMLRRADLAMYRAKESGRNRIEVYDRSVDDALQQAVSIQHELRRAIDTDALEVHYQPIVRLADRGLTSMEALVRMRGADGQLLSPAAFVPQAEATGLVVPMGAWVIQRALTDLAAIQERHGVSLVMAVNVSPTQLREDGFADFLLEQMAFAGVPTSSLGVEITETALIHDPAGSSRELRRLSEAGVRVSLDDFGTGYSSLSWLTQFPVDVVKVDKSFTDEVGLDERKTAIVSAVVAVSHELGFTVVAEGIETEDQAQRLLDLGCDHGQGYLFGRPVAIGEGPWW